MRVLDSRALTAGLLFVVTLASGVWVSGGGRPYASGPFTIHKLVALGAVVLTALAVRRLGAGAGIEGTALVAVAITALLVLALFVSGGLMSAGKPAAHSALLAVHRVALLVGISAAAALYLLARQPALP